MPLDSHFVGWTPGSRMHAHVGSCIKCGGTDGDATIYVRVYASAGRLGLNLDGVGTRLCPQCKAKYLPLTPAMDRELDRLGAKLWRDLRKRGCPCCQAGLDWYPAEHAH
jgi:hypothetical protein